MGSLLRIRETINTSVLVIGGGAAALRAAVEARARGADVVLAVKGGLCEGGYSFYPLTPGWGMQITPPGGSQTDSVETFVGEIVGAGQGMADPALAEIVAKESGRRFKDLCAWGVKFKMQGKKLNRVKGCFSDHPRAVVAWDMNNIRETFRKRVVSSGARVLERTMAVRLIVEDDRVCGALAIDREGAPILIQAHAVILAPGGGAQLFERSFAAPEQTGDGCALAFDAGATLKNLEFIQWVFALEAPISRGLFPEMLLGKRPDIRNEKNEPFLLNRFGEEGLDRRLEERARYGPFSSRFEAREVDHAVFAETFRQIDAGRREPGAFLRFDASRKNDVAEDVRVKDWIKWLAEKKKGFDFWRSGVKVLHYAHAFNGGIEIGKDGETCVDGLFACGEAAAGMHGADRLGGAMIAASQVFGARAGAAAARRAQSKKKPAVGEWTLMRAADGVLEVLAEAEGRDLAPLRKKLQKLMQRNLNVWRTEEGLRKTLDFLYGAGFDQMDRLKTAHRENSPFLPFETRNMLKTSKLIALAALRREESRGAHFRADFPDPDDERFGAPITFNVKTLEGLTSLT